MIVIDTCGWLEYFTNGPNADFFSTPIKDNSEIILKEQVPSKSGLGLGLYLCGKTIKQFGGQLKVKTAAGKGTTFTMVLPAVEEKKES